MSATALEDLPGDPEGQQKPFACLGKIKTAGAAVKQAKFQGCRLGSIRYESSLGSRPHTRAGPS